MNKSGQWGHHIPPGAAQEVKPPWCGQGTGDSWLCACVGLDTCSAGSGALGTSCLPLCRSIPLSSSSLCYLKTELKVSRSRRAGRVQLGHRCSAIPQTADSAILTSGPKWLESYNGFHPACRLWFLQAALSTRTRESFLKCLLVWAELCLPHPHPVPHSYVEVLTSVPRTVTVFGDRTFKEVIKLK